MRDTNELARIAALHSAEWLDHADGSITVLDHWHMGTVDRIYGTDLVHVRSVSALMRVLGY